MKDKQILGNVPSPYVTGLLCRCPRCGKGKLFSGYLTLKPHCDACSLDFSFADAGDGPAIFVIMIAGAIVVGAALVTEVNYQPPYWLHALLWIPLILALTLWPLRALKSLLISSRCNSITRRCKGSFFRVSTNSCLTWRAAAHADFDA